MDFMYSDEWCPYIGYDKRHYDIKTHSGEIFLNCYPNAGTFHCEDGRLIQEDNILEIRLAEESNLGQPWIEDQSVRTNTKSGLAAAALLTYGALAQAYAPLAYDLPRRKVYGRSVEVRTTPKIGRNAACPCGSGLKFKRCCLKEKV